MKNCLATGLLCLLLYHLVGQAALLWLADWRDAQQITERLSVYHSTDDLVEFEIPVPLHQYGAVQTEESTGGEFEYQGHFYDIARQTLRNDTLHIFCYEDRDELARRQELTSFIKKNLSDDGDPDAPSKSTWGKNWVKDYARFTGRHLIFIFENQPALVSPPYLVSLPLPCLSRRSPPPQRG